MLVLAVLGLLEFQAPDPKPWIHRVVIAPDTVWFEGDRGYDNVKVRYCYAPSTGAWCKRPRLNPEGRPPARAPRSARDSVGLAPGVTLVCQPPVALGVECETFGLRIADEAAPRALLPRADTATLAMLQKAAGIETELPPSMSGFVTAWTATDDAVWFGLGGGFPEGEGAYGGLLRFDRMRHTVETVTHPRLADATVTGLAVDGGTLWIGTLHPAEFGPVGSTGVLCQDLRTGRWTMLDSAGAHLPDKVIQAIAARNGTVFIATRDGLATYDTRTSQWSVRYFRRMTTRNGAGWELTAIRPRE